MPAVGAWLVGTWTGTGLATAALKIAASLALNLAVAKLTRPDQKGPKPRDIQTELRQSNAPRIRHLGRVRTSGSVMFWDWAQYSGNRVLFKLIAVGQGGFSEVEQWYLNDVKVETNVGGPWVQTEPWQGRVALRSRQGLLSQPDGGDYQILRDAFPGQWTLNHKLTDVGTYFGTFEAVKGENIAEVYSGGEPMVSAVIRGDRCLNPSGPGFWTDNPAYQLRDVLTNPVYGALADDDIDNASFEQAATDCAEAIPLAAGGTIARYFAGGSYTLSEPLKDVAQRILDSFAGRPYITTEGKIGVRSGKWRAPNYTITEDKIVAIDIGPGSGEFDRVTTLVPKYVAPEIDYQETTASPWDDAAAISLYGESVAQDMDLPWVQHHGQARRLAKIQMAKLNPAWRATITLRFWGLLLLEEENVFVDLPSLGLNNAPAWIDSFSFDMNNAEGVCTVELIAANPASFDWDAVSEEGQAPSQPQPIDHNATLLPGPVINSLQVITGDGDPYITVRTDAAPSARYLWARYFREPDGPKFDMFFGKDASSNDVWRTAGLQDQGQYTVELTWTNVRPGTDLFDNTDFTIASATTVSSGIEVFENTTPPDPPVVISESGTAGGAFEVTFEPDLGVNYRKTELWRGAVGSSFANATFIKQSFATSQQVTMNDTVPGAGADYWIISVNPSGVKSSEVFVGSYS
ncbi:phage tail protein [Paracoccus methylarcula]|uniref:Tip attachment protein J domain-containing protein n=1 Tax=Paracoccus methylarcula TaxID=72022 RepID=A0A422QSF1_9RHOB|nr:phage tail protein [Paracoccus methylarcula]RNF32958.1 hypothetical protein A7A09_019285 [Paracoccus methylarcula]